MHRGLLLFLVVLFSAPVLCAAAGEPSEAATQEEIHKLQGIWQVTEFINTSEEAAQRRKSRDLRWSSKEIASQCENARTTRVGRRSTL